MNEKQIWTKRLATLGLAAATLFAAGDARAEYVENQMGVGTAQLTLAIGGSAAVAFDLACAIHLGGGTGDQTAGLITGIGSLLAGTGLIVGSGLALSGTGEGAVPVGSPDGPEADALTEVRALAGVGFGLAALSYGLGIASLVTIESDDDDEGDDGGRHKVASWQLSAAPMGGDGGGVLLRGTF